jgi:hypothetical protein
MLLWHDGSYCGESMRIEVPPNRVLPFTRCLPPSFILHYQTTPRLTARRLRMIIPLLVRQKESALG